VIFCRNKGGVQSHWGILSVRKRNRGLYEWIVCTRKVREATSGNMDILVTHRCKMGCDMWDKRIESHRRWLLHARAYISCSGGALCQPYMPFKHCSCRTGCHLPQGAETGDLRSSRHIPQVSSDIASVALLHCQSAVSRILLYVCKPLGSVSGWIRIAMNETRRGGHV